MPAPLPTLNQFSQNVVLGQLDAQSRGGSIFSCEVSTNQVAALVAGQPVKLDTASAVGVPKILSLSAASDPTFGIVAFVLKDINYPANARVEVATEGSVIYLNSSAAITRGAAVEADTSVVGNVITSAGINPIIGIALDGATAANQLIRIYVTTLPARKAGGLQVATITATLAQINAGLVLIPGVTGKKITVSNYTARVTGAFATGTAVLLEDTAGSPVLVSTLAEAGLTNGAILLPSSANTTLGAGFAVPLTSGAGLQVANSGSAQTGGTSIQFTITYFQG